MGGNEPIRTLAAVDNVLVVDRRDIDVYFALRKVSHLTRRVGTIVPNYADYKRVPPSAPQLEPIPNTSGLFLLVAPLN